MGKFSVRAILAFFVLMQHEVHSASLLSRLTRVECMDELGCFDAKSPFFNIIERPVSLLPDDRETINTKFKLYTAKNPTTAQNFSNFDKSIDNILQSGFNPGAKTKFIAPGFMSGSAPAWKLPLVEALVRHDGSNVFFVDWSGGDGPIYAQAVANTRVVGAEIALFVNKLQNITKIRPETIHIIGHSLGAHISGYAGKRIKNLGRITGLDPAGPYYTNVNPIVRLDRGDAILVEAIHTNAADNRFEGFGLKQSIAHFDFYINGGYLQPGCKDMGHAVLDFLTTPPLVSDGLNEVECNHIRAVYLFQSSITSTTCKLTGKPCNSLQAYNEGTCGNCGGFFSNCIPLGLDARHYLSYRESNRSLNLYLNTTDTSPYCKN